MHVIGLTFGILVVGGLGVWWVVLKIIGIRTPPSGVDGSGGDNIASFGSDGLGGGGDGGGGHGGDGGH